MEKITEYFDIAFRILGANHPFRLALGVLVGVATSYGCDLISRIKPESSIWREFASTSPVFYIAIGLILVFLPLFLSRTTVTEKNAYFLNLLSLTARLGGLSKAESRQLFRSLAYKLVDAARPNATMDVDTEDAVKKTMQSQERK